MSEENKNSGTISKEKALSLVSALSIIGMCFGLYTGVFDRGTSTGSFTEKLSYVEKQINRFDQSLGEVTKELKANSLGDNETRIDIIKLYAQIEQLRNQSLENKRLIEILRDHQFKGGN